MQDDIVIEGLNVSFRSKHGETPVVRDVNVTFSSETITGLIGESGSGKSVLGMSILQLLPDTAAVSGTCRYHDMDLYALSEKEMCRIRGSEIGLIPQNPTESMNPVLSIGKQLKESITVHARGKDREAAQRRDMLLQKFGFDEPERINRSYSFQLSGGMNQRVISTMGLMNKPNWVIADEPTKGLDAILRKQVYRVLKDIAETETRGMIIITHDISLAGALCDRLLVLYKGMIMEQGKTADILENPLHPYTKGLIGSLPEKGMHPIRRADPVMAEQCRGCSFAPRCEYADRRCMEELPPEKTLEDGRTVRCFHYA